MQRQKIKIIKIRQLDHIRRSCLVKIVVGKTAIDLCVYQCKDENRFLVKVEFFSATCFIYKNISTVNKEH